MSRLRCSTILAVIVFLVVVKISIIVHFDLLNINQKVGQLRREYDSKIEKWIVVTTINYPTEAVKALASQKGWRVVIVADKKTPADWNFTNCDFLSIETQKELNFSILSLTPFQSYTRKMIGYLYAIKHGARWIYDTDDDNQPIGLGMALFDTNKPVLTGLSYGDAHKESNDATPNLFNPYAFWGQPSIWPRGYPMENVRKKNDEKQMKLCKRQNVPVIQQGLVMEDPDVDAIYRLLNADEKTGLKVDFNEHTPPIFLNSGTFCPFNSQNTLFHYDAFWALFLPVSVSFRVTDIWRSYFAQKFLHLTGNRLGFYPVNAVQKRNAHSNIADFINETQLYGDAGRIIEFISNWTCESELFTDCMLKLSFDFSVNKFWTKLDYELVKAWTTDLKSVGYIFPTLFNHSSNRSRISESNECRGAALHFSADKNRFASQIKMAHSVSKLKDWCNEALTAEEALKYDFDEKIDLNKGIWRKLRRLAVIVSGNYPFGPFLSLLQRLYEPYFATVIFCGTVHQEKISRINSSFPKAMEFSYINVTGGEINAGYRAYICTTKAIEMRLQNIDGYITIADDAMYNFWNDFDYSRFRLWGTNYDNVSDPWWRRENVGRGAMKIAIAMIQNRTKLNSSSPLSKAFNEYIKKVGGDGYSTLRQEFMWSVSDFYYLPKENETVFYELAEIFFEAHLFHEIAVPKIGAGLGWYRYYTNSSARDIKKEAHLWYGREQWDKIYKKDMIYFHPIKLSRVNELDIRKKYCTSVIRSYLSSISIEKKTTTSTTTTTTTTSTTTTTTTTTTSTKLLSPTTTKTYLSSTVSKKEKSQESLSSSSSVEKKKTSAKISTKLLPLTTTTIYYTSTIPTEKSQEPLPSSISAEKIKATSAKTSTKLLSPITTTTYLSSTVSTQTPQEPLPSVK